MRFSERTGLRPPKLPQSEGLDEDTVTSLWNALLTYIQDATAVEYRTYAKKQGFRTQALHATGHMQFVFKTYWVSHEKKRLDLIPYETKDLLGVMLKQFFSNWINAVEIMEFMLGEAYKIRETSINYSTFYKNLVANTNHFLSIELAPYRVIDNQFCSITNEEEINSIQDALGNSGAVSSHISAALALYSSKSNPDYRNSVKESISAVEAACKIISGDENATLGKTLKKIDIHPSLEAGFGKLYGYTSSKETGIRHALMDKDTITADEAKYFLISCSAFANYLLTLSS